MAGFGNEFKSKKQNTQTKLKNVLLDWSKKKDFMNIIVARMVNLWVQIIFLGQQLYI